MAVTFHHTATVVRPGTTTDRGGNQVEDWTNAARTVVDELEIQPETQAEDADATRVVMTGRWRVISAPGTAPDVRARDRVEWDGLTYEVDGEIAYWPGPTPGAVHHIEFALIKATG